MSYHHLTPEERGQIQALRNEGKSRRAIARTLGRHPATVGRELARHRRPGGGYDARQAQARYRALRAECRKPRKLDHPPLRRYVQAKIAEDWSPEQVAGRLAIDHPEDPKMRISPEALYRSIYRDEGLKNALIPHLRQGRKQRRKRGQAKTRRMPIPNRVGIEERPAAVEALERYGDWEGDLVLGPNRQGALVTLVERKSLALRTVPVPAKQAEGVARAVVEALQDLPGDLVRTITFDNGPEFARHETIARALDAQVYFARPYASCERAQREHQRPAAPVLSQGQLLRGARALPGPLRPGAAQRPTPKETRVPNAQ